MDIVSHGLWGGIAFGRKSKRIFCQTFLIGIAPDALSFGLFLMLSIFGFIEGPDFNAGSHIALSFPPLLYTLYNITHSLIVFFSVFFLLWLILKKPFLPLLSWGLHVFMDIFTHSFEFFPTPFLWPVSDFKLDMWAWGNKWVFIPNVVLLALLYLCFFIIKRRKLNKQRIGVSRKSVL